MSNNLTFRVGINEKIFDKSTGLAGRNQAIGWMNLELTQDQLIQHVCAGHAISAHFRGGHRKTANFICSDMIAADVDEGLQLEDVIHDEFVKSHCSFLYTTPSHTEEIHRFRLVFLLQETILDPASWSNALRGLAIKMNSDRSIKDAGRQFYGNSKAQVIRFDRTLFPEHLSELITTGESERARSQERLLKGASFRSASKISSGQIAVLKDGTSSPLSDLPTRCSVRCPSHLDRNASAFVIRSARGSVGIHCMTCRQSFWSEDSPDYDFDAFDRLVADRHDLDRAAILAHTNASSFDGFFPPDPSVQMYQQIFLPALDYEPGITLVKSPKGSGKTEALKALVHQIRTGQFKHGTKHSDRPKSILLIGHRQSLIREAASKLDLPCYLDKPDYSEARKAYAICLDSLPKLPGLESEGSKATKKGLYDVVILDESEQIFSHLLSETISSQGKTDQVYHALDLCLRRAKAVYALDADLGLISGQVLKAFRPEDWEKSCRIIHNAPIENSEQRELLLFEERRDLQERMLQAVKNGKRCFVVSNAKSLVDTFAEVIRTTCGDGVTMQVVTSENSRSPDSISFVKDIKKRILDVQVLLCSPSLGTGIDITFPDGGREIDHVFGFFYPFVNTHMDIDQQLARVRNPGEVAIWIQPGRFNYETNFDVIRDDLARAYWVPAAVKGRADDGRVDYDPEHPLLLIAAHVICSQRASKKRLPELFRALREGNGWRVVNVPASGEKQAGGDPYEDAAGTLEARRVESIWQAQELTREQFKGLEKRDKAGSQLGAEDRNALVRYTLQAAIAVPLTPDIIGLDRRGKFVGQVQTFSKVFCSEYVVSAAATAVPRVRKTNLSLRKASPAILLSQLLAFAKLVASNGSIRLDAILNGGDLVEFGALCQANRTLLEEVMQFELRKDVRKNPVRQLNAFLDLAGLRMVEVRRRKIGGVATSEYGLDPDRWERMCELVGADPETGRVAEKGIGSDVYE